MIKTAIIITNNHSDICNLTARELLIHLNEEHFIVFMQITLFLLSICPLFSTFLRRYLFRIMRVVFRLWEVSFLCLLSKRRLRWWVLNLSLLFIYVLPILLDLLRVFNMIYKGMFCYWMLRYYRRLSRIIRPIFFIAFEFFYFLEEGCFLRLFEELSYWVGCWG